MIPGLPGECLAQMRKEICVGLLVVDMNDFMSRTPPKELGDGCTVRIGEQCSHRTEVEAKPGDACEVDTFRATLIIPLVNQGIMLVAVDVVSFGKETSAPTVIVSLSPKKLSRQSSAELPFHEISLMR